MDSITRLFGALQHDGSAVALEEADRAVAHEAGRGVIANDGHARSSLREAPQPPFERYRGHLQYLRGRHPDELVEEMRGR